jgi:multisubunit Na+/H+ antiporter MnhC subunit
VKHSLERVSGEASLEKYFPMRKNLILLLMMMGFYILSGWEKQKMVFDMVIIQDQQDLYMILIKESVH